jgi:hypothetical protein
LLREDNSFTSRDSLIAAYEALFGDAFPALNTILKELKGGNGGRLKSLAVLRHVMVHKGGIADSDFSEDVQHDPALKIIDIGERIVLDGEMVTELVTSSIKNGSDLLAFANDWLAVPA